MGYNELVDYHNSVLKEAEFKNRHAEGFFGELTMKTSMNRLDRMKWFLSWIDPFFDQISNSLSELESIYADVPQIEFEEILDIGIGIHDKMSAECDAVIVQMQNKRWTDFSNESNRQIIANLVQEFMESFGRFKSGYQILFLENLSHVKECISEINNNLLRSYDIVNNPYRSVPQNHVSDLTKIDESLDFESAVTDYINSASAWLKLYFKDVTASEYFEDVLTKFSYLESDVKSLLKQSSNLLEALETKSDSKSNKSLLTDKLLDLRNAFENELLTEDEYMRLKNRILEGE
jgi:hypothetical protein